MTTQPTEPSAVRVRHVPQPIDPDSPAGKNASRVLGEIFDEIAEALQRAGEPVPDYLL